MNPYCRAAPARRARARPSSVFICSSAMLAVIDYLVSAALAAARTVPSKEPEGRLFLPQERFSDLEVVLSAHKLGHLFCVPEEQLRESRGHTARGYGRGPGGRSRLIYGIAPDDEAAVHEIAF